MCPSLEAFSAVFDYFETYWFCPGWLPYILDCCMPPGETRDSFGTNNITESMFKVFDNVVLGNTCNRRLDLLVVSIIDAMLPYYRDLVMTAQQDPRVSHDFRQILADGYLIFDRDLVTPLATEPASFSVGN
ncbi:hypothetical protein BCR44DRAFT_40071, partial [Catenaria anguillulae PL171]